MHSLAVVSGCLKKSPVKTSVDYDPAVMSYGRTSIDYALAVVSYGLAKMNYWTAVTDYGSSDTIPGRFDMSAGAFETKKILENSFKKGHEGPLYWRNSIERRKLLSKLV